MPVFILFLVLTFPVSLLLFGCGYLLTMVLPLDPIQGTCLFSVAAILLALSFNFMSRVILHQSMKEDFNFDESNHIILEKPSVKKKKKKVGRMET